VSCTARGAGTPTDQPRDRRADDDGVECRRGIRDPSNGVVPGCTLRLHGFQHLWCVQAWVGREDRRVVGVLW